MGAPKLNIIEKEDQPTKQSVGVPHLQPVPDTGVIEKAPPSLKECFVEWFRSTMDNLFNDAEGDRAFANMWSEQIHRRNMILFGNDIFSKRKQEIWEYVQKRKSKRETFTKGAIIHPTPPMPIKKL